MGWIATVLDAIRTQHGAAEVLSVTFDRGANILTGDSFGPCGDDSPPLPTDLALTHDGPRAGSANVGGYADPLNEGEAAGGEKRIYARDADGAIVGTVWLKGDGDIEIESIHGSFIKIGSQGIVDVKGPGGSIITLNAFGAIEVTNAAGASLALDAAGGFKLATSGDTGTITMSPTGVFVMTAPLVATLNGAVITALGEISNVLGVVLGTHVHETLPGSGIYTGTPKL